MRLFDRRRRMRKRARRVLARFLKCRKTGRQHRIHPRLLRNLFRIQRAFKGRTLYVYSGYRHPRVSLLPRSYHTRGRAIDFRVAGVSRRRLRDYVMKHFSRVGVGYYPNSLFVHMDVRRRSAFWVDLSGPGETPRYAANPYAVLARERRGQSLSGIATKGRKRRRAGGGGGSETKAALRSKVAAILAAQLADKDARARRAERPSTSQTRPQTKAASDSAPARVAAVAPVATDVRVLEAPGRDRGRTDRVR